jgi:dihydrofolate reductase
MRIRTRMCTSLDGFISTPDGLPVQLADPQFDPEAYGFVEFQANSDAVLMGHTTLMPALEVADQWPWSDVDVFVLASERPAGTPDDVVIESDPKRLLERVREANRGGDVHLIGGPTTIETYRALRAIDEFGFVVLPILVGDGMQMTPAVKMDDRLELTSERALPKGAVELLYEAPSP